MSCTTTGNDETIRPDSSDMQTSVAFDERLLLEQFDGDAALVEQIGGLFLRMVDSQMEEIRRTIISGDAKNLREAAHKFYSASRHCSSSFIFAKTAFRSDP